MSEPRPMHVDVALVRELAMLLDETDLTEIEVADGDRRVRVARESAPVASFAVPAAAAAAPAATASPAAPAAAAPSAPVAGPEPAAEGALRSPMVGTAYLSPEPGAPPFVREGDEVREGQTLLIIEAMKVMNPITAPRSGRIARILVANEQPVEFDQPLIVIA
ncbi:MAG: acetyl-CoA carboxylase biotin carboxyl carrier protein [Sphingomonadaceae bacterium]